jgi:hypothetical protein
VQAEAKEIVKNIKKCGHILCEILTEAGEIVDCKSVTKIVRKIL